MYKVVPFLRVRYGDVAQNGPADDVVAVATGLFLKGAGLTPESMQTVASLKKTGASSGGLFLSGRPQCLRSDVYAAVQRRSSVFENPVEVRNP